VILSVSAITIGCARAVTYLLERRRWAPAFRSLLRQAYHLPRSDDPRVHHFVPGVLVSAVAGAAAILTRRDGHELRLALPFGVGVGLALDEVGLLVDLNNPYWGKQWVALAEGTLGAAGAAALGVRFYRIGVTRSNGASLAGPRTSVSER
jgi:hypothetical protein